MKPLNDMISQLVGIPAEDGAPKGYRTAKRNISILILVITLAPTIVMTAINYLEYQRSLKEEILAPMRALVNKTKDSFELFLSERLSTLNFISSAYTYDELADEKKLNRIFRVIKKEFEDFVDLDLINSDGTHISYAGPYYSQNGNYAGQGWFDQVKVKGVYVSDVFRGFQRFPNIAVAVQHIPNDGREWILRATINIEKFDNLISSMNLDPESDAFLINHQGVLQTKSKFYGDVLEQPPLVPPKSLEPIVIEQTDYLGRHVFLAYSYLNYTNFIFALVRPLPDTLKEWYISRAGLLISLLAFVVGIFLMVLKLTDITISRIKESDDKRLLAMREMEHSHKLASIGRLAAGVAHEVNNPLAIVNEKAGLMKDLIEYRADFPDREKFLNLVDAIIQTVERCRAITHRLLGFARRIDVEIQILDLNEVIKETLAFLEKEALYRNIAIKLNLDKNLPRILSDKGQLQQVFLNLLNNAFAAIETGGTVYVATFDRDEKMVGVTFEDTGQGMSDETLKHIFEPFFTTKKAGYGTGLGLSISSGIIKRLGGEMGVRSKLGEGTTFTIYIPKETLQQTGDS
ncbi:MAG: sensor histidine kinase [Desulfomonilaceae bacterium]